MLPQARFLLMKLQKMNLKELLDKLHGEGSTSNKTEDKSAKNVDEPKVVTPAGADSNLITEDEFESLLDTLQEKGEAKKTEKPSVLNLSRKLLQLSPNQRLNLFRSLQLKRRNLRQIKSKKKRPMRLLLKKPRSESILKRPRRYNEHGGVS